MGYKGVSKRELTILFKYFLEKYYKKRIKSTDYSDNIIFYKRENNEELVVGLLEVTTGKFYSPIDFAGELKEDVNKISDGMMYSIKIDKLQREDYDRIFCKDIWVSNKINKKYKSKNT